MELSYVKVTPTTFQAKQKWQLNSYHNMTAACKTEGLTPQAVTDFPNRDCFKQLSPLLVMFTVSLNVTGQALDSDQ